MSEPQEELLDQDTYLTARRRLKIGDYEHLSSIVASPIWPALRAYLIAIQNKHTGPLFDAATPFPDTQYHRGALAILREIVTFLETDARAEYDKRVAAASQRGSESTS